MNIFNLQQVIRDSVINSISINLSQVENGVSIKIFFEKGLSQFEITFSGIEYYIIDYQKERGYQYVENIKILKTNDLYYVSLDPYNEEEKIDERDGNCIISKIIKINNDIIC